MPVDGDHFPFALLQCIEGTGKGRALRTFGDTFFTQRVTYHTATATSPEYVGYTEPGNGISASAWAVKRILYDSNGQASAIQWASGNIAMNKVFDDRTTYTYT